MSENDDLVAVVDQLCDLVSELAYCVSHPNNGRVDTGRVMSIDGKARMLKGRARRAA